MQTTNLGALGEWIHREVVLGLGGLAGVTPRRLTLQLGLECAMTSGGAIEVVGMGTVGVGVGGAGKPMPSVLTLELDLDGLGASVEARREVQAHPAAPVPPVVGAKGGTTETRSDGATLRRRLELVLGGPPGFTTGAKAEMLADLLRDFGTPTILGTILSDWVTQFDTGIEASPSFGRTEAVPP